MRIGIDVSGGDFAPDVNIEGAVQALESLPEQTKIVLIGDEEVISTKLNEYTKDRSRFEIVHAPEVITMHEHPTKAFKQKPNSSIAVGFFLLKEGKLDAFASTGNTGAMLIGSMFVVRSVSGVIRPCITTVLPKIGGGYNIMLDVGTNADCKPDVLFQFGILGSLYSKYVFNIENPKVGLINIGEEEEKGNLLTQATFELMKGTSEFNFVGNIEGRDLYSDKADVMVCDGFTGNVLLKQAEAFYTVAKRRGLNDEYFNRFNYELYGGTPVLGINANVIIGHGISSARAIKNMLILAKDVAESKLSEKIKNAFA